MLTARRAADLDDLRTAADLTSLAWLNGAPFVAATPAAIEWWYALSLPDELGTHLRLWHDATGPVAWSWHDTDEIEWHVRTGDADRDVAVFRAILETAIEESGGATVGTFAAEDDDATVALLEDLGFAAAGRRLSQWQLEAPDETPAATPLPDGYRIRGLEGPADIPARVAVHRSAFPTSRLNTEMYERLTITPHYRFEDDLVVETADGSLAAYAMAWWDGRAHVGEFEPVGTHPDHQRQGLARALLGAALLRYFEMGALTVQVYSDTSSDPAERLYEALGFRRRAFHQRYERPASTTPGVRSTR